MSRGLVAIINAHHDDALYKEPAKHEARLQATWRQVATRYKDRPDSLYFELLNEPNGALTDEIWQEMFPKLLAIVRESNPKRAVIIGPGHWSNVDNLKAFQLPEADRMLIGTFHYYNPFHFTHQGTDWTAGSDAWRGETWTGTPAQREALKRDFEKARNMVDRSQSAGLPRRVRRLSGRRHAIEGHLDRRHRPRGRAARILVGLLGVRLRLRRL